VPNLGNVLKRFGGKAAMNLEQLDGFLVAIVCHPAEIPKAEYLPEIWGDEMINEDTFAAQPMLQGFLSLIARHKDTVAHTLQSGDVFTPLLLANTNGVFPGNDWADGFVRGMGVRREDWTALSRTRITVVHSSQSLHWNLLSFPGELERRGLTVEDSRRARCLFCGSYGLR
jgi:yecA family protein